MKCFVIKMLLKKLISTLEFVQLKKHNSDLIISMHSPALKNINMIFELDPIVVLSFCNK